MALRKFRKITKNTAFQIKFPALDKQDFKDDSSLFKFFPDEEIGETSKLRELVRKNSKHEFKFLEQYKTKTLLLVSHARLNLTEQTQASCFSIFLFERLMFFVFS